jgi:hypothetical protein
VPGLASPQHPLAARPRSDPNAKKPRDGASSYSCRPARPLAAPGGEVVVSLWESVLDKRNELRPGAHRRIAFELGQDRRHVRELAQWQCSL